MYLTQNKVTSDVSSVLNSTFLGSDPESPHDKKRDSVTQT